MSQHSFTVYSSKQAPQSIIDLFAANQIQLVCFDQSEQRDITRDELIPLLKDFDAYLSVSFAPLNADFIQEVKHLKTIATLSVGYDHIDVKAATAINMPICNTPDVLSEATASTAFILAQMVSRKIQHNYMRILKNQWKSEITNPLSNCGFDLRGKTVGVFGLGKIGFEFAKMCVSAYGMKIIYHNRSQRKEYEDCPILKSGDIKYVSFDELLSQSDVLSIHANLTPQNKGIFNYEAFQKMKPNAVLINTARGAHIVEADLIKALDNGLLAGAGLDVFCTEPIGNDHPLFIHPLITSLPHIGSQTVETRMAMWELAAKNIINVLQGKQPPACVNAADIYKQ